MTTAFPQHARGGALAKGWRSFRRWRRTRPFWGGLFTLLSGLEIFATTQMSLGGLSFQMGPTGFLSWLVPTILVACGLLMWFTPQQRMFYAVIAAMTAVYSLIGVNLGGFFIGLLLGLVGSALGFAWTPVQPPAGDAYDEEAAPAEPEPAEADAGYHDPGPHRDAATVDDLLGGPMTDTLPPAYNPLQPAERPGYEYQAYPSESPSREHDPGVPPQRPAAPDAGYGDDPPEHPGGPLPRRSPRLLAIIVLTLSLSAAGLVMLRAAPVAYAEPEECPPKPNPTTTATAPTKPAPTATTGPTATPTPTPTAAPEEPGENPVGEFFGGVVDGFKDLLGIGEEEAPAEAAEPTATPTPTLTAKPRKPAPKKKTTATAPEAPQTTADCTTPSGTPVPPAKRIQALPGQPNVAKTPSRMTGSRVTMWGLSFDGVVELPTVDGVIRVLQFSMDRSVTNDFELRVPGPNGRATSLKSSALTVEGNVKFYASRFHGTLLGIPLTFTP
ncbi:MAG TPA: DUF6114 domain-containing protein, partial [Pilimelia sp.]|nr:DUF6114 domain-containing protein [Pilimelia sp.]